MMNFEFWILDIGGRWGHRRSDWGWWIEDDVECWIGTDGEFWMVNGGWGLLILDFGFWMLNVGF